MPDYQIVPISPHDKRAIEQLDALLSREGIRRDPHLDYICGLYDDNGKLLATGSCLANTLRCLAVSKPYQGEGLLCKIVTHLIKQQYERGNYHLFLYTKCDTAEFFKTLGFYEIIRVDRQNIVFMENQRAGFENYLNKLKLESYTTEPTATAVVMNANPFTLGHQFLVKKASQENRILHLFVISEDTSLIPFSVRKRLVIEGTAALPNIIYHESGSYMISHATFPSYFQKDELSVIESHAKLDLAVFQKIAKALGITRRYVGEEPTSQVTSIYNRIMKKELPKVGIECIVIPRKKVNGKVISASTVRQSIHDGDFAQLKEMLPPTTLNYFTSKEALPIIRHIQSTTDVIHY